jgi:diguanylate cyclase (GGDEF)-like protein
VIRPPQLKKKKSLMSKPDIEPNPTPEEQPESEADDYTPDTSRMDLSAESGLWERPTDSEIMGADSTVMNPEARILVVDDEDVIRGVIAEVLRRQGIEVAEAAFAEDALEEFEKHPYPVVVTDIIMGKMNGLELLREVKRINPTSEVIVMTSNASMETAVTALREGAYDYLIKPFESLDFVFAVVNRALQKLKLEKQNLNLVETLKNYSADLEVATKALKSMAERDGLTDLYNHRHFRESLDREIARASRESTSLSLIIMDLDYFKNYNDSNGHLAGDKLLKKCSRILKAAVRGSDLVARYGGEEFVLILPDADQTSASQLAERIRETIADHPFPGRETQPAGRLTASFGVATFPQDGEDANSLIDSADQALYKAKQKGRNAVAVC